MRGKEVSKEGVWKQCKNYSKSKRNVLSSAALILYETESPANAVELRVTLGDSISESYSYS